MIGLDLFILCVSYAYLIRHLVCTAVVQGLDNFQVGVRDAILFTGLIVDPATYMPCLVGGFPEQNPIVVAGNEVEVACDMGIMGQWLIIQSLDTGAEKLCIGEVAVEIFGEYCIHVHTGAASNAARNELLMLIFCRIIIADKVRRECR